MPAPTTPREELVSKFYQRKEETGHTIIEAEKVALCIEIEKALSQARLQEREALREQLSKIETKKNI